jgi:hypothetical protein
MIHAKGGNSVLSAIGEYGKRRIQIIMSKLKSGKELIRNFDINILKVYYDRDSIYYTYNAYNAYNALHDWITNTCNNGTFIEIKLLRLVKIYKRI